MDIPVTQLPPGDPRLVEAIVGQLKSRGIFDQFRKECLADVDTKPAFQNLRQRVEGHVNKFLEKSTWKNDMNKNQLRDGVRKHVNSLGILESGIDAIITQVVNPKIKPLILPYVEDTVYAFLQIDKPKREKQEFLLKEPPVVEPIIFPAAPEPAREIKPPPTLLPMETDVISSEEDDILARESPEAVVKSSPPTPETDVIKEENEDAQDGFEAYPSYEEETTEEMVVAQVERLHLTTTTQEVEETKPKPTTLPLFDDQSLDSISSNSSGLTFSTLSGKVSPGSKKSLDLMEKSEDSPGLLLQESRSTTSTPLVDEKPIDEEVSRSSMESELIKDYPTSETKYRETLTQYMEVSATTESQSSVGVNIDQIVESGSIGTQGDESQESKGSSKVSTISEKSDLEEKVKYEKSEGEISSSSSELSDSENNKGQQSEQHRSEECHSADSSYKSKKPKSDHKSKRDSHTQEQERDRDKEKDGQDQERERERDKEKDGQDKEKDGPDKEKDGRDKEKEGREKERDGRHHKDSKERKHSRSRDDHHSHRDKDRKHHRRDKDHDGDRGSRSHHTSAGRDASTSGGSGSSSGSGSGSSKGAGDNSKEKERSSHHHSSDKSSEGKSRRDKSSSRGSSKSSDLPDSKLEGIEIPETKSSSKSESRSDKSDSKSSSRSSKTDLKSGSKSESRNDKLDGKISSKSDKRSDAKSQSEKTDKKHDSHSSKSSSKHKKTGEKSSSDKHRHSSKEDRKKRGDKKNKESENKKKVDKDSTGKSTKEGNDTNHNKEEKESGRSKGRTSKSIKDNSSKLKKKICEKEDNFSSDTESLNKKLSHKEIQTGKEEKKGNNRNGTKRKQTPDLHNLGIDDNSLVLVNDDGNLVVFSYEDKEDSEAVSSSASSPLREPPQNKANQESITPKPKETQTDKHLEECDNNNIDKENKHDFEGFDSWTLDTRLTDYLRTAKRVPDEMDAEFGEWFDASDLHMVVSEDNFSKKVEFGKFLCYMRKLGAVVRRGGKEERAVLKAPRQKLRSVVRRREEEEGTVLEAPQQTRLPIKRRRVSTSSSASSSTSHSGSPQHKRMRSGRWGRVGRGESTHLQEQDSVTAGYLLTPEDDGNRTSSRDYVVDYSSQRITTYSPLSPASDSSADDGKHKTGDTSSTANSVGSRTRLKDSAVFNSASPWSNEKRNISV